MSSSFIQGFHEDRRDVLLEFVEDASDELARQNAPLAYELVIERLATQVSHDVRVLCGFHKPSLVSQSAEEVDTLTLQLPIHSFPQEIIDLCMEFNEWKSKTQKDGVFLKDFNQWNANGISDFVATLHHTYGHDAMVFANMIQYWVEGDPQMGGKQLLPDILRTSKPRRHLRISIDSIWNYSVFDEDCTSQDRMSFLPLFGFILHERLFSGNTFNRGLEITERLLFHSEIARKKAMLLMQSFRHKPHNYLARQIANEGYSTFLDMEAMTELDICRDISILLEKVASDREEECGDCSDLLVGQKIFPDDFSQVLYLTEDERNIWRSMNTYCREHAEEPRQRICDLLPCAQYRDELALLRRTLQWDALGAKEREICNRIFSEVVRIPYAGFIGGDKPEDRMFEKLSYQSGTPQFAVENQQLTCFTGPWLIAALCLECGIPYNRLYYCSVYESNADPTIAATHGALLVGYADGTMAFFDYGHRHSGRVFLTEFIENFRERKEMQILFDRADELSDINIKSPYDPVRVSIDVQDSATHLIYKEMHVLPLDQGFNGTQLLHTGLSFLVEGRTVEALEAFELGLTFFPSSPDLLCQCAMIHFEKGDIQKADWLLDIALHEYANHMLSLFYKGKVLLSQGNRDEAYVYFRRVASDPRRMWADDSPREWAKQYILEYEQINALKATIKMHELEQDAPVPSLTVIED